MPREMAFHVQRVEFMESAVFYLNAENSQMEFLGKIESDDEAHALRKLGEIAQPYRLEHPQFPGLLLLWSGRFGVGQDPQKLEKEKDSVSVWVSYAQKCRALELGEGNLSTGVYRALWAAGRNGCSGISGKPTDDRVQILVLLSETDRHLAKTLGGGKISVGIRRALDAVQPVEN